MRAALFRLYFPLVFWVEKWVHIFLPMATIFNCSFRVGFMWLLHLFDLRATNNHDFVVYHDENAQFLVILLWDYIWKWLLRTVVSSILQISNITIAIFSFLLYFTLCAKYFFYHIILLLIHVFSHQKMSSSPISISSLTNDVDISDNDDIQYVHLPQ